MTGTITSLGPREDLLKRIDNKGTFQHKGIKMLDEEIQYLELKNNELKEYNNAQLKIREL